MCVCVCTCLAVFDVVPAMDLGSCLAWRSASKLPTTLANAFRRCGRVPKAHLRITTSRLLGNVYGHAMPDEMWRIVVLNFHASAM